MEKTNLDMRKGQIYYSYSKIKLLAPFERRDVSSDHLKVILIQVQNPTN